MLTAEENDLLTRIGPGTRMGALMRRYWHPVAAVAELDGCASTTVRLLGEDLELAREGTGFVLAAGARSYPVEELGGLLFGYLGPEPRPLVPRFDGFVAQPAVRMVGRALVPCNWLQIMENSVDPVHTEWLHGHLYEWQREMHGRPVKKVAISQHHVKIAFDEFDYGIYKRRLLAGQSEDTDDWRTGHPVVFPNLLAVGNANDVFRMHAFQIRVPMDDTHTMHYWYNAYVPLDGRPIPPHLRDRVPVYDVPFVDERGEYLVEMVDGQDIMAWITQGPIADRTREALGSTDRGVTLFRRMLRRELAKVEGGGDPIGVIRDPARNAIALRVERGKAHYADGFESMVRRTRIRFSPVADELIALFAPPASSREPAVV